MIAIAQITRVVVSTRRIPQTPIQRLVTGPAIAWPTEVAPRADKFGKQIRYADRRGIPFVWFPARTEADGNRTADQVKDIRSGEQVDADRASWMPPEADRLPSVVTRS